MEKPSYSQQYDVREDWLLLSPEGKLQASIRHKIMKKLFISHCPYMVLKPTTCDCIDVVKGLYAAGKTSGSIG